MLCRPIEFFFRICRTHLDVHAIAGTGSGIGALGGKRYSISAIPKALRTGSLNSNHCVVRGTFSGWLKGLYRCRGFSYRSGLSFSLSGVGFLVPQVAHGWVPDCNEFRHLRPVALERQMSLLPITNRQISRVRSCPVIWGPQSSIRPRRSRSRSRDRTQ